MSTCEICGGTGKKRDLLLREYKCECADTHDKDRAWYDRQVDRDFQEIVDAYNDNSERG